MSLVCRATRLHGGQVGSILKCLDSSRHTHVVHHTLPVTNCSAKAQVQKRLIASTGSRCKTLKDVKTTVSPAGPKPRKTKEGKSRRPAKTVTVAAQKPGKTKEGKSRRPAETVTVAAQKADVESSKGMVASVSRTLLAFKPEAEAEVLRLDEASKADDFQHGIPNLQPPWRWCDLHKTEQLLYVTYGPNFVEHTSLPPLMLKFLQKKATQRRKRAAALQNLAGPDWYSILKQAQELREKDRKDGEGFQVLQTRYEALLDQGADLAGKRPLDEEARKARAEFFRVSNAHKWWCEGEGHITKYLQRVLEQRAKENQAQTEEAQKH